MSVLERLFVLTLVVCGCRSTLKERDMPSDDPNQAVKYQGPSRALAAAPPDGVSLVGYVDSDAAVQAIDRLLSAHGIPFHLERPHGHWSGTRAHVVITVPADRQPEVQRILTRAAEAGLIEAARGADGLVQY